MNWLRWAARLPLLVAAAPLVAIFHLTSWGFYSQDAPWPEFWSDFNPYKEIK